MRKTIKPPTQRQYDDEKHQLLAGCLPRVYPCQKCQWPVLAGYCCTTCGDTDPSKKAGKEARL